MFTYYEYVAVNTDNNEPLMKSDKLDKVKGYMDSLNKKVNRNAVVIFKRRITVETLECIRG